MYVRLHSSFRYGRYLVIGLLIPLVNRRYTDSRYAKKCTTFSDLMITLELTDKHAASSAGLPPAAMHQRS